MIRRGVLTLAIFTVVVVAIGFRLAARKPLSPTELAIEHCRECGMDREWVEQTVSDIQLSGQTREQAIEAWERTYDDPDALAEARVVCLPCVEAVVNAAGGR